MHRASAPGATAQGDTDLEDLCPLNPEASVGRDRQQRQTPAHLLVVAALSLAGP